MRNVIARVENGPAMRMIVLLKCMDEGGNEGSLGEATWEDAEWR
jgi:hypothetical protein